MSEVTKCPGWMGGILLPGLGGVSLGSLLGASTSFMLVAAWQGLCGLAMIVSQAPKWGEKLPQSRRLMQLYGSSWLGMGLMTVLASKELPSTLATSVLTTSMVSCLGFSIGAGPKRMVDATDNERKIIPTNSFVVALGAAALYKQLSATK